jgi:DNA primase
MTLNDDFREEVRRTADIVRYVSDFVQLRKVGGSWKGLCPFHNEKTPSFNVSTDRQRFHCFGCGEGGDVFKFAMLKEKANFPEAIEIVARRFGMQVPERSSERSPDREEREQLLAVMEAALEHFAHLLWTPQGTKAREYLLGRGFRKETLEKIRAGAAADSWRDLLDTLGRRFPTPLLMTAGLVLESQDGKRPYDRFRGRAIFPIMNDAGRVVAFGARSLDGSEPKYLNSPENPAYHKSKVLYGLSWAKDAIRREGRAVLMEGYLDVARAIEAGVGEAIATCGTALTAQHARLLRRFTDRAVLMEGYLDVARAIEAGVGEAIATCGTALTAQHARLLRRFTDRAILNFDQDDAGQKAARKSIDILLEEGFKVHIVELPDGHDPDTYLKAEGADAYRRRIDEAPGYMDWLIRRAASEHDLRSPAGKSAYLNALLPTLARIESPVERAAWLPTIVETGGLDTMAAREEVRRALAHRASSVAASTDPMPVATMTPRARRRLIPAEKLLIGLILSDAPGISEALEAIEEVDLQPLASAQILRAARQLVLDGRPVTLAELETVLEEDDRRVLSEAAVEDSPEKGVTPAECVKELKSWPLKSRMAEIQKDLPKASGEAQEALLAEKLDLKRRMSTLFAAVTTAPVERLNEPGVRLDAGARERE